MASTSSSRLFTHLRMTAIIAVGTHVGVTLASMGYATGRFGGANAQLLLRDDGKAPRSETAEAQHFVYLTEYVTCMYAGRGLQHDHVQLAIDVTFADPAAICRGRTEVQSAFAALRFLQPKSIRPPRCIHVEPKGASILVTYSLYQRYFLGRWIALPSLLVLEVQLQRRHGTPYQSDFVVLNIQEQWNGVPLLTTFLNQLVRRCNGILSYRIAKVLMPRQQIV